MSLIPPKKSAFAAFRRGLLNGAARGGPGRLIAIVAIGGLMVAALVFVSIRNEQNAVESKVAKMKTMNLLPGGTHSTPAQDALLLRHSQEEAKKAEDAKQSYTPAMPGSVALNERPPQEVGLDVAPEPVKFGPIVPEPHVVPAPPPAYVAPEKPLSAQDETRDASGSARIEKVSSTGPVSSSGQEMNPETRKAIDDLFTAWEVRPPRTTVVLTPAVLKEGEGEGEAEARKGGEASGRSAAPPTTLGAPEKVLVPAGRGVYAHTIVSVNSDAGGPIILEADTGPLAGDRMIGAFSKSANDRLVVRVQTIEHRGKTIEVNGLLLAPDSMETSVASSVDQHYFERFALPAAAAFVQGLGQAVAMSNATTQVSPFGGTVSTFGPLKFKEEAMIAGGAAGQAIGGALTASTPKGPTINLAANVGVGVMFLSNVSVK